MAIRINYRNIPIWLADQLRRPKWFKNLFVTGNAWAAFSKHSHVRASDGQPKVFYPTKEKALKAAEKMSSKHGVHFSAYKCLFCDGWHVGRNKENKTIAIMETEDVKHAGGIDVERMMRSSIPDLLPIYGGFRGRTLSSPRLQYAWKTIVESGVSQVIDLRADYKSDHYKEVCKAHGIDYFHYRPRRFLHCMCSRTSPNRYGTLPILGVSWSRQRTGSSSSQWLSRREGARHKKSHGCFKCILQISDGAKQKATNTHGNFQETEKCYLQT